MLILALAALAGCQAAHAPDAAPEPVAAATRPVAVPASMSVEPAPARYFAIEVVDDQTGRGVPLVELSTVSNVRYWTDSNGLVAIDDPALIGRRVFFHVRSDGYEFPADGFGFRGKTLEVSPAGHATLRLRRLNIAERLYRLTGEGIYRDSVLLGRPAPTSQPLLNAEVVGQDSVQSIVYRGKIHWFFGDTNRQSYAIGHFGTSGATSELPSRGGLDPEVGVDLNYFTNDKGFSRPVFKPAGAQLKWLDGLMVLKDEQGRERLIAKCDTRKSLTELLDRQLMVFNDQTDSFEPLCSVPLDAPLYVRGHPFQAEVKGKTYCYFCDPFPSTRVAADWASIKDTHQYEAFTPLIPGSRGKGSDLTFERDAAGKMLWAWKRDTAPLTYEQQAALIRSGKMKPEEAHFSPLDVETGKPIYLATGSVCYNEYRHRWIMIATQWGGKSSFLGEVWYSEAEHPEGPWLRTRRILTHDRYSFYNPAQHPFFDRDGGRIIYFEGTYAATFSRDSELTPRYDYNQMMYRLDLADPRLDLSNAATKHAAP